MGAQALQQQHGLAHHLLRVAGAFGQDGGRQPARPEFGASARGVPAQQGGAVLQVEAAGLLDSAVEVAKARDGLLDEIPQQPVVIPQGQPVHPLAAERRLGHACDDVDLGETERRDGLVHAGGGVDHAEGVLHRDLLDAGALQVELGAPQAGEDQGIF